MHLIGLGWDGWNGSKNGYGDGKRCYPCGKFSELGDSSNSSCIAVGCIIAWAVDNFTVRHRRDQYRSRNLRVLCADGLGIALCIGQPEFISSTDRLKTARPCGAGSVAVQFNDGRLFRGILDLQVHINYALDRMVGMNNCCSRWVYSRHKSRENHTRRNHSTDYTIIFHNKNSFL